MPVNETDGAEEKKIIKEKRREERGPAQAGRRRRQGAAAHTESWGSSPDICHEEVPLIRRYGGPGRAQMPASPVDPSLCNPNYNTLALLCAAFGLSTRLLFSVFVWPNYTQTFKTFDSYYYLVLVVAFKMFSNLHAFVFLGATPMD